jgi:hypothetical protein
MGNSGRAKSAPDAGCRDHATQPYARFGCIGDRWVDAESGPWLQASAHARTHTHPTPPMHVSRECNNQPTNTHSLSLTHTHTHTCTDTLTRTHARTRMCVDAHGKGAGRQGAQGGPRKLGWHTPCTLPGKTLPVTRLPSEVCQPRTHSFIRVSVGAPCPDPPAINAHLASRAQPSVCNERSHAPGW